MKCSAFWKHTNIRAGNKIYPCCRFKSPVGIFDGDLENVLHSDTYKMLRNRAMNNEFIPGCDKCAYEEKIGHKSLRQEFNEKYNFDNVELEFLEIGFDNLCNLVCDGCNSEFSTSWISKEEKIFGKAKNKLMEIDYISTVPSAIKKILFLGGEPLIVDKHFEFITRLQNKQDIELIYNTNASYIPKDEITKEFDNFKSVKFIVSIDGYGELNEQVRGNSKWQDTLDFVDYVVANNFILQFNTVVHKNNYHGLFELEEWIAGRDWYVNVLTYPLHLDIKLIDENRLNTFRKQLEYSNVPTKNLILQHIKEK